MLFLFECGILGWLVNAQHQCQIAALIFTESHVKILLFFFCFSQVEYLLKKICMAMSVELNLVELEDFISQDAVQQNGFSVWAFLEMMNSGKLTRGIAKETISMAIEDVYREIVGDVLKEVLALSIYISLI